MLRVCGSSLSSGTFNPLGYKCSLVEELSNMDCLAFLAENLSPSSALQYMLSMSGKMWIKGKHDGQEDNTFKVGANLAYVPKTNILKNNVSAKNG